jgi:hypothetical protein
MCYRVIGLCGYARCGKDTAARFIQEEYGGVTVAFAGPLRRLALRVDAFIEPSGKKYSEIIAAEGYERAKSCPGVRAYLESLGEGARECLGDDVWVIAAKREIQRSAYEPIILTDVRHQNEAEVVRAMGGIVVRIVRAGNDAATPTERANVDAVNGDVVVVNDAMDAFRRDIIAAIKKT